MADLIYAAIASLDGYVADASGGFQWAAPDAQVHAAANDLERPIGTYLYGRRMYEVMAVWQDMDTTDEPPEIRDYADIWRGADKVVYSTTLQSAPTARTRIARAFDPDEIRRLKETAARDLSVGGTELAARAIAAGLVDQIHLFLVPVLVGGGTRALPDGVRLDLELIGERRFAGGVVHLHYGLR